MLSYNYSDSPNLRLFHYLFLQKLQSVQIQSWWPCGSTVSVFQSGLLLFLKPSYHAETGQQLLQIALFFFFFLFVNYLYFSSFFNHPIIVPLLFYPLTVLHLIPPLLSPRGHPHTRHPNTPCWASSFPGDSSLLTVRWVFSYWVHTRQSSAVYGSVALNWL